MSQANIHSNVDVAPIGDQLFDIANHAWQEVLADSGDTFDRRYDGIDGVGLALLTSADRPAKPVGGDNPLAVTYTRNPVPNLAERGTHDPGLLRYRYNHRDTNNNDNTFDPSLLGVSSPDQIPPYVLIHGRFPTNGAAKRFFLLNHPDLFTSHNRDGLVTGNYGELGAAGAIRLPENLGIVAVSGGNQAHDHVISKLWARMAVDAIDTGSDFLTLSQEEDLKVSTTDSMKASVEFIKTYVAESHRLRLDELDHASYAGVISRVNYFLAA